ncbi:hypothetical protein DIPPA_21737 [Diplonema papillatum]|nr:hypothetical protein DIPPA_21737 [Diplonema papillatum]
MMWAHGGARPALGVCRRGSSVWAAIAAKKEPAQLQPQQQQQQPWRPPPKDTYSKGGAEAAGLPEPQAGIPLWIANALDKGRRPDRMGARKADLPWPGVETSKSIQVAEVESDTGVTFWSPKRAERPEDALVLTDFTWEDDINPVLSHGDDRQPVFYDGSYVFTDGGKVVQRTTRDKYSLEGDSEVRSALTNEISFRTRELIEPNTVAYLEMHLQFACLHFGYGIWDAEAFNPRHWIGYEKGSVGTWEDGRLGTREGYEYARVLKPFDDAGVLLYSPPGEKTAKVLFMNNGKPSGKVITIPKAKYGWYFGVSMINYHTGGARAAITQHPVHTGDAMRWLAKLEYGDDEDFDDIFDMENFKREEVVQPYCRNRWNPYHVCSGKCKEASERLYVNDDEFGKPQPSSDLPMKPSWLRRPEDPRNFGPHRKGSWRHVRGEFGERYYKTTSVDRFKNGKSMRTKKSYWNLGNMSYS